jgi:hypothetical protein
MIESALFDFLDTIILGWFNGQVILDLFDQYFLSLSDVNQVLLIVGVSILTAIGIFRVILWILKVTFLWIKIILFIGLAYYIFVVLLGIDIWSLLSA